MPSYQVTVVRYMAESVTLEIEGTDEHDVTQEALDIVDHENTDGLWEFDGFRDPAIVDVTEVRR